MGLVEKVRNLYAAKIEERNKKGRKYLEHDVDDPTKDLRA